MDIESEFLIYLLIQLLILAFFIGIYVATIKFMQQQISELKTALKADKQELKEEMRKYNSVLERMIIVEQSAKSAHHRIDGIENENK